MAQDGALTGKTLITKKTKQACKVEKLLGSGGQGEVYMVEISGVSMALKWYHAQTATADQKIALEELINQPAPDERFIWPMDLVEDESSGQYGYVMRLFPPGFRTINALLSGEISPSLASIAWAGFQLADSFNNLQNGLGFCYRDVAPGNVLINADTGDILICDNDNVTVNNNPRTAVLGTPRFMAPEIVRGEALPSTRTDRFSLAVLLFYMLMMHHPLDGELEAKIRSLDLRAMNRLYGTDPVFIFDETDSRNRPNPVHHLNALVYWPIYPKFIRDLFHQSFTVGLKNAERRVTPSQWRNHMLNLRDALILCQEKGCGAENFYDQDAMKTKQLQICWHCHKPLRIPARIRINGGGGTRIVMLNPKDKMPVLYPHHTNVSRLYDFSKPTAEISKHPEKPLWGLRNLTNTHWHYTTDGTTMKRVEPGKTVILAHGLSVDFGDGITGEVRLADA